MADTNDESANVLVAIMDGVREYGDGKPVELVRDGKTGRLVVVALNEDGCCGTTVDLLDLLDWCKRAGWVAL